MSIVVPDDVGEMVTQQMATGRYQSSDEVLRSAMKALAELDEDLVAIQEAIADWQGGDVGVPLNEVIHQIRTAVRSRVPQ